MNIIICIDDGGAMTFLGKRQSRDKAVCRDIINSAGGSRILVTEYSLSLFGEGEVTSVKDPLKEASADDFCFIENENITPYLEKANRLIIYKWNRLYPSDKNFVFLPKEHGFFQVERTDFKGKSHKKITKEVYAK